MRRFILFVCSCFLLVQISSGKKDYTSIPFEMVGSYVVIKVRINNSTPLNLILDSGVRSTIITELFPEDIVSLNFSENHVLSGLGTGTELKALVSNGNQLKVGKTELKSAAVYVLQEDVFNLSKHTGTKINGLIGVDFFKDHIVHIDYTARRIRFYQTDSIQVPKGYASMPLTIEKQKMYINLSVLETDTEKQSIKMLIDTGAELNAWFQTISNESVHTPEKRVWGTIGYGLNGKINGYFARVPQICIGEFCLKSPIVAFPDSASISEIIINSDRDGTIGSQMLSRFNIIIDYKNKEFHFKPNINFTKPFSYNIAGIEVAQILPSIPQTEVMTVWEGSPADLAGVKVGDQIIEIEGIKAFQLTVNEVKGYFSKPSKHPLQMVLLRKGEEIPVKIDMKSKI